MAQLIIFREKSMMGMAAPMECYVNGKVVCKVKNRCMKAACYYIQHIHLLSLVLLYRLCFAYHHMLDHIQEITPTRYAR